MNVNIRLNKNFQTQFNKMCEKYGEEFLELQGLNDEKLSFTDFIDNFIDSDNVANASVDSNANVAQKDIVTMTSEMSKPHQKLLAFNKLYYEINKKYGFKIANQALEAMWNYGIYMHDFNTSTFLPYCIKPEECCTYLLNGKTIYASFKQIYELVPEVEEITENGIYFKRPKNLCVQDLKNGKLIWTKVHCISKKIVDESMRYIKGQNGFDLITTESHKYITENGDIAAKDLLLTDSIKTICQNNLTNNLYTYNGLELTKDLGWLIGMYLSEGYNQKGQLTICQHKEKNKEIYTKIIDILEKNEIPYTIYEGKGVRLKNGDKNWERKILSIAQGRYAWEKSLCPDYIHFNFDFLKGILSGIVDGDGTISKNKNLMIRMTSRTLINQIKNIGHHFGVFFSGNIPYIQKQTGKIQQKHIMYSASANMNQNKEWFLSFDSIKIKNFYTDYKYDKNFVWGFVFNDGEVLVKNNEEILEADNMVFDLSTETHHFLCNGIQVHNCFAYDLKEMAEKGLFFIEKYNAKPPKHLDSFVQILMETISFCSRRSSGAVGLPNLIPYLYYFWNEDCKNGYCSANPEAYKRQQIEALIYRLNQPWIRTEQAAFTNVSVFDHPYFESIFGAATFPDGSLMIDAEEEIIQFQKDFIDVVNKIREDNIFTFPVLTASLLYKEGHFVDEEFAKWACEASRKWNLFNFFIDSEVTSLSNCCRLKSNIKDLYFNSIGGTALKVGSVKVSTVNLARIAYEAKDETDYLIRLRDTVELNLKILDVQRHIIERNVEKGLLPNFSKGLIDFPHLYSTCGLLGTYEVMKTFGYTKTDEFENTFYKPEAYEFGKKIFKVIHNCMDNFSLDKNYTLNLEAIPGEQAAVKMQKADQMLFPEKVIKDLPLYGNQWIPLGIKTTIVERTKICATFDSYCNGGSIEHINVDAPFDTFDKAWKMLNWVAEQGVTYFAFNGKISQCKNYHSYYGSICPHCGEKTAKEYTRVVGFYTCADDYSKERAEEFKLREWHELNNKGEKA